MRVAILIVLLSLISYEIAYSQSDKQQAKEFGMQALEFMEKYRNFPKAIELLERAKTLDPENIVYPYEIAYAKYHLKQYSDCIEILEKLTTHTDVNFRIFQLLGNSYDMNSQSDESISAFKRGLEKYPNSGSLYLGCGIVEDRRQNHNEAIRYWEKGVEAEPMFASNYYWLAITFAKTNEPMWGLFYGEIFMNLERDSDRNEYMSKLLYALYEDMIEFKSDTEAVMKINNVMTLSDLLEEKIPFSLDYNIGMNTALAICVKELGNNYSIKFLSKLRSFFLEFYIRKEKNNKLPHELFEYQRTIMNEGYLEEYNYWVFMQGNLNEFIQWRENNPGKLDSFAEWFKPNQIRLTKENYFSRTKF